MNRKLSPNQLVAEVLYRLNVGARISPELLKRAFFHILTDEEMVARDVQLGAFLVGLGVSKPTEDEVVALLQTAFSVDKFSDRKKLIIPGSKKDKVIGVAGSGKKGRKAINISTGASLLAAALGIRVAKTVSCSTSSKTGSADFLTAVGVNLNIPTKEMAKVLQKISFGAFKIENLIDKFDRVYGGKFFAPHALSFGLAALVSPVKFDALYYGLANKDILLSAKVLRRFGVRRGLVVNSTCDGVHYMDELAPVGKNQFVEIRGGKVMPAVNLNLSRSVRSNLALEGKTKEENVRLCVEILRGRGPAYLRDFVCLNAGGILFLAGAAESIREGNVIAKKNCVKSIALEKLEELIFATGGSEAKLRSYLS